SKWWLLQVQKSTELFRRSSCPLQGRKPLHMIRVASTEVLHRGQMSLSATSLSRVDSECQDAFEAEIALHMAAFAQERYSTNSLVKRSSTGCADWEIPCSTSNAWSLA